MSQIILDQFGGTAGNLTAHSIAPTNVPGTSWSITPDANWVISGSNYANASLGGNTNNRDVAYCNAGVADVTTTVDITTGSFGAGMGVAVNFTDTDNTWLAFIDGSTLKIYEVNGGGFTVRDSVSATTSASTQYQMTVITNGDAIAANLYTSGGGSLIATTNYTGSPRYNKTVTNMGVWSSWNTNFGTDRFANFSVSTGSPPATVYSPLPYLLNVAGMGGGF